MPIQLQIPFVPSLLLLLELPKWVFTSTLYWLLQLVFRALCLLSLLFSPFSRKSPCVFHHVYFSWTFLLTCFSLIQNRERERKQQQQNKNWEQLWAHLHIRGSRIRSTSALKPLPAWSSLRIFALSKELFPDFFTLFKERVDIDLPNSQFLEILGCEFLLVLPDHNLLPGCSAKAFHQFRNPLLLCGSLYPETKMSYLEFCTFFQSPPSGRGISY